MPKPLPGCGISQSCKIQVQAMSSPNAVDAVELIHPKLLNTTRNLLLYELYDSEYAHQMRLVDRDLPGYDDISNKDE